MKRTFAHFATKHVFTFLQQFLLLSVAPSWLMILPRWRNICLFPRRLSSMKTNLIKVPANSASHKNSRNELIAFLPPGRYAYFPARLPRLTCGGRVKYITEARKHVAHFRAPNHCQSKASPEYGAHKHTRVSMCSGVVRPEFHNFTAACYQPPSPPLPPHPLVDEAVTITERCTVALQSLCKRFALHCKARKYLCNIILFAVARKARTNGRVREQYKLPCASYGVFTARRTVLLVRTR